MAQSSPVKPEPPSDRIVAPGETVGTMNERVAADVPARTRSVAWWAALGGLFLGLQGLLLAIIWLFTRGVGIWGLQIPVGWGFAIINFVWWIGIGHAGTFISAILLLLHQSWRNSINRIAEAMTLFAVACAGLFPLLHLGRPQYFYYLLPYPNRLGLWPQFRSPLVWDFFAVATYGTVSLLFWYLGTIPDLATKRDRAGPAWVRRIYGFFALGWLGTAKQWRDYHTLALLLAGLATPLVVSVHSIVGLDFAISIVPGWHSTIFPPFFVAGAIFSGFAMVVTLVVPLRRWFRLESFITRKHLDNMGKVMLVTGLLVGLGYLSENFFAWYSGDPFETMHVEERFSGAYAIPYYTLLACNLLAIQVLWFRAVRISPWGLWIVALFANIGMWLERYLIVVPGLARDYLPSSWQDFDATGWDWLTYAGTIVLFLFCVVLFLRLVPVISMHEMRELLPVSPSREKGGER